MRIGAVKSSSEEPGPRKTVVIDYGGAVVDVITVRAVVWNWLDSVYISHPQKPP